MPDNYFDKELQDQLQDYRADYNPADWAAMEHMLDRKWYALPWVRTLAIAALLTGTALTAWVVSTDKPETASEPSLTEQQQVQRDAISQPSDQQQNKININESKEEQTPVTNGSSILNKSAPLVTETNTSAPTTANRQPQQKAEQDQHLMGQTSGDQTTTTQAPDKVGLQVKNRSWQPKEEVKDPLINYPTRPSWADMPEGYVTRSVRVMDPLKPLGIDELIPKDRPVSGGTDALRDYKQHSLRFWIGASCTPALNFISNARFGYQASARLGVDVGKALSLETGLGYTRFSYNEPVTAERQSYYLASDPYFHESTQGDLRYLEIPLRINYNLGDFSRLQPYVAAGVSALITIREDYIFNYQRNPASNVGVATAFDQTTSDTIHLQAFGGTTWASTLQEEKYSNYANIYKPATTDETVQLTPFYLMGQLATGVNYLITPETALNLGINYRFPMSGFGVENRNLHTVGVEVGLKQML